MQTQAFLAASNGLPESVGVELSLKLHTYPKPDREPVKILIIGSRPAINAIVHTLHQLRFAEVVIGHSNKEGLMRKPSKPQDHPGKRAGGEHPDEAMSSKRWSTAFLP
jgi:hypothetical protein